MGIISGITSLAQSANQNIGTNMQMSGAQSTANNDMQEMIAMANEQRQLALTGAICDLSKSGASAIENAARKG